MSTKKFPFLKTKNNADKPIGVFDSGVGGLTVFKKISRLLPQENIVYLGDTARLPYGNKTPSNIKQYSLECAHFLLSKDIKLLVVACHTASAHALTLLQEKLPIPVIGVIQPGLELLMRTTKTFRVAILGTASTIASNVYPNRILQLFPEAHIVSIACPLFVSLAEEHFIDHPATDLVAEHYLKKIHHDSIDSVLLACTHYPLLQSSIQKALPPDIQIVESADVCAKDVEIHLTAAGLCNHQTMPPQYHFFVTDHSQRFTTLAKTFLGQSIDLHTTDLKN